MLTPFLSPEAADPLWISTVLCFSFQILCICSPWLFTQFCWNSMRKPTDLPSYCQLVFMRCGNGTSIKYQRIGGRRGWTTGVAFNRKRFQQQRPKQRRFSSDSLAKANFHKWDIVAISYKLASHPHNGVGYWKEIAKPFTKQIGWNAAKESEATRQLGGGDQMWALNVPHGNHFEGFLTSRVFMQNQTISLTLAVEGANLSYRSLELFFKTWSNSQGLLNCSCYPVKLYELPNLAKK